MPFCFFFFYSSSFSFSPFLFFISLFFYSCFFFPPVFSPISSSQSRMGLLLFLSWRSLRRRRETLSSTPRSLVFRCTADGQCGQILKFHLRVVRADASECFLGHIGQIGQIGQVGTNFSQLGREERLRGDECECGQDHSGLVLLSTNLVLAF